MVFGFLLSFHSGKEMTTPIHIGVDDMDINFDATFDDGSCMECTISAGSHYYKAEFMRGSNKPTGDSFMPWRLLAEDDVTLLTESMQTISQVLQRLPLLGVSDEL